MKRAPLLLGGVVLVLLTLADFPRPVRLPPALKWRRTVGVNGGCPGVEGVSVLAATSVTYCYTVTNTGATPARGIVFTDAGGTVRLGTLAGGQSRTIARTLVVAPDADWLAVVSSEGTAPEPPVAGSAEAASTGGVTPPPSDPDVIESASGIAGAPIAPGLVFLGSTTAAAPAGTTLQSP